MRSNSQLFIGIVMILGGIVLLYLLRDILWTLIVFVLGFFGVVIGLVLLLGGIAMVAFSGRRGW